MGVMHINHIASSMCMQAGGLSNLPLELNRYACMEIAPSSFYGLCLVLADRFLQS